jgi:NTP pyrophosphatase (non-canonical NTP hydrolase)
MTARTGGACTHYVAPFLISGIIYTIEVMKDSPTYKDLEERIIQYGKDRNWQQFHTPKNMALSLSLEANEVLELFQWSINNDIMPDRSAQLSEELADVFYWLIKLSHHYQIDLGDALQAKMAQNEAKYPIAVARDNPARHSEM